MLPKFIIGGIAKNGTSYLHSLVKKHPQIEMPARSMDYSFFDNDLIYKRGFNWYKTIFEGLDETKMIGQVSADCAFNPGSIERVKKHLPNIKLIFIFRNPIDSVYSLYWHQIKMGREYRSFEKALKLSDKKSQKNYYNFKMFSYLNRYRFSEQVIPIKKYFDENQILFIPFEIFIKNDLIMLNKVFNFLGVDQIKNLSDIVSGNVHKNKAKLPRYQFLLWLSYQLQQMKLKRLGRYILNKTLVEKRPPKMNMSTRKYLEDILAQDIKFHKNLIKEYENL